MDQSKYPATSMKTLEGLCHDEWVRKERGGSLAARHPHAVYVIFRWTAEGTVIFQSEWAWADDARDALARHERKHRSRLYYIWEVL